jgi:hypothetical protein
VSLDYLSPWLLKKSGCIAQTLQLGPLRLKKNLIKVVYEHPADQKDGGMRFMLQYKNFNHRHKYFT